MYIALSIVIGSVLFFGVGVAASLFQTGVMPDKTMAGFVNSIILQKLNTIVLAGMIFSLGCALYLAFADSTWMGWTSLGLGVVAVAISLYLAAVLFPRTNVLRTAIGNFDRLATEKVALKSEFDSAHAMYSAGSKVVLVCALGMLVMTAFAATTTPKKQRETVADKPQVPSKPVVGVSPKSSNGDSNQAVVPKTTAGKG